MPDPAEPVCEHVLPVLLAARDAGLVEGPPSTPWERNCRWWVFVSGILDLAALRERLGLADELVDDHVHRGTHDGAEQGFVCTVHHDAVIGYHPEVAPLGAAVLR